MSTKTYEGGCHCGAVRFRVELDLAQGTGRCNCSFCRKTRSWGTTVKPQAFQLLRGADALSDYQFATKSGHHRFCKHCGVHSHGEGYVEQLGGAFVSVQLTALDIDDEELAAAPVAFQNGRDDSWWTDPKVKSYL
jgi:hypothetical protein